MFEVALTALFGLTIISILLIIYYLWNEKNSKGKNERKNKKRH